MTATTIEWATDVWNWVTGCTRVSEGCRNCYIERTAPFRIQHRRFDSHQIGATTGVQLHPDRIVQPLRWRKPRRVFVNSMGDLFHAQVPDDLIARSFVVMAATPRHTYLVLTKRPGRMRSLLNSDPFAELMMLEARRMYYDEGLRLPGDLHWSWPLPNVWLGVSVECQQEANLRIPVLYETSATVRFLSCEPLLGPVDLSPYLTAAPPSDKLWCPTAGRHIDVIGDIRCTCTSAHTRGQRLHWVICGGETGPNARPMHPDWARRLRDQCQTTHTPYFFKQWGDYLPVPVFDAPTFSGGRAFDDPRGGRSAAVIREPGSPFQPGKIRPLRAGDRNGYGQMLDDDTMAVRVGKKRAGAELDGRTWVEFPKAVTR